MTDSAGRYSDVQVDENTRSRDQVEQATDDFRQEVLADELAEQQLQQDEQRAVDVQYDPRNSDTWGAKALIKEGQSILSGGLQDTILDTTFQSVQSISGEMQRTRNADVSNGLVHFGSLAVGTIAAAKAIAATVSLSQLV